MSMSDPVADLLTRIRNANMRNKENLILLSSVHVRKQNIYCYLTTSSNAENR